MSTETLSASTTTPNSGIATTCYVVGLLSTNGSTFANAKFLFSELDKRWPNLQTSQNTSTFLAAPTNSAGAPTFRVLALTDIPSGVLLSGNNLSDVASPTSARSNLSLGSAALLNTSGVLQPSNNLSEVANTATARTNLGLGSAALLASSAVLQASNNGSDIANTSTFRTNIGLGSAALLASSAVMQTANNGSDIANTATFRSNIGLTTSAITANTSTKTASTIVVRDASGNAALGLIGLMNGTTAAVTSITNGTNVTFVLAAGVLTISASGGGGGSLPLLAGSSPADVLKNAGGKVIIAIDGNGSPYLVSGISNNELLSADASGNAQVWDSSGSVVLRGDGGGNAVLPGGFTGTVSPVNSITVLNGVVTAVS